MKRQAIGMVAASLLACSVLSGCQVKPLVLDGTQVAIEVDDEKATLGSLASMVRYQQALTYDQYMAMMEQYEAAGYPSQSSAMWSTSLSKEDKKAYQESSDALHFKTGLSLDTVGDRMLDSTTSVLVSYMVASEKAEEYGVSLSDADKAKIQEVATKFMKNSDQESLKNNGITQKDVESYLSYFTLFNRVKEVFMSQQDVVISEEEAKTMSVQFLRFPANMSVEEDKKKASKKASEYLKKAKENADYTFQTAVEKDYKDATIGQDTLFVHAPDGSYIFGKEDIEAMEQLSEDALYDKVIEGPDGWYVLQVLNPFDKDATLLQKENLLETKKETLYRDELAKWIKESKITYHTDVIDDIVVDDTIIYTSTKVDKEPTKDTSKQTDASKSETEKPVDSQSDTDGK